MLVDLTSFLHQRKRLEGVHHGIVADNNDPERKGHVKVRIPGVLDGETDSLPWCAPKFPTVFGGLANSQAFVVPKTGSAILVEFENPYCLWYTGWAPSDLTVNDLFHDEYPNSYGIKDEEFLVLVANRSNGDVLLVKRATTGENTLAYLGPEAEVDVATAGRIDLASVENTINVRARQDINLETNAENEASGSVFRIRGTLLMDTYGGLTVKSNGSDMIVDTGGGNLTATTGEGSATLDVGGDISVSSGGNVVLEADGDISITASGNVAIKGSRIDLN